MKFSTAALSLVAVASSVSAFVPAGTRQMQKNNAAFGLVQPMSSSSSYVFVYVCMCVICILYIVYCILMVLYIAFEGL